MKTWTFVVPGPLRGYQKDVAYSHSKKYKGFKAFVRLLANSAGVPSEATETMSVEVYFKRRLRGREDGSNLLKAIEDALFAQDGLLCAGSWRLQRNTGEESATVTVREE